MRPALLAWALAGLVLVNAAKPDKAAVLADEAVQGETPANTKEAIEYTTFNGIKVPPMPDLKGKEFAETIKDGYWYEISQLMQV